LPLSRSDIAEHWLAVMMAGPFILDEFPKWGSPKARAWLNHKFPPEKRRRFEIIAMVLGAFLSGYLASEEHLRAETNKPKPLSRMLAYALTVPEIQLGPGGPRLVGFQAAMNNVGTEPVVVAMPFLKVSIDNRAILSCPGHSTEIIQPTESGGTDCRNQTGADPTLTLDTKTIIVDLEVHYDTLPESGVRRSYRKIEFEISWPNGITGKPDLARKILDEWER